MAVPDVSKSCRDMEMEKSPRISPLLSKWNSINNNNNKKLFCFSLFLSLSFKMRDFGIKTSWRYINNLRYADDTTLMAESEEELKSILMKVRGEWKSWLKTQHSENSDHGIWSHHFMETIWGEKMKTVADYIFLGSKITVDSDCSHEIKKSLLLGRKAMTNLDSILKSRDITLLTKVHIVKAMVFPYSCRDVRIGP